MSKTKLRKVSSLAELRRLAAQDDGYKRLLIASARNLGFAGITLEEAYRWLEANAMETDEGGVVDEVNASMDLE